MDLSVIIVNWNSAEYVRKCVSSIHAHPTDIAYEIIVVDNASYDSCEGMLNSEFPGVKFIQSGQNLGFARANNLGFQHATGRSLLFLNPDTEVHDQALSRMYHALVSLEDAGAMGCRLLNSDGSLQTSCVQPFPTLLNQSLDIEFLKALAPSLKLWGMAPLFQANRSPASVDVVSGACLMVRRSVFQQIDMFSTDYFMYTEDIDLCFKVKQAGYKVCYLNDAEVVHHGGGSRRNKGSSRFSEVLMRESVWTFMRKYRGPMAASGYRSLMFINASARVLLLKSLFFTNGISSRFAKKRYVTTKWMNILRWSLGIEKWARNLNNGGTQPRLTDSYTPCAESAEN